MLVTPDILSSKVARFELNLIASCYTQGSQRQKVISLKKVHLRNTPKPTYCSL